MTDVRKMRTRKLNQIVSKKVDRYVAKDLFDNQGAKALLECLQKLYDFELVNESKKWLIENCGSHNELIYAFQLFLQRAINKGRSRSTLSDFYCITENIDFSILYSSYNHLIGCVYTLGVLDGKVERIEIRSCAIPVKKGKGTITCIDELSIHYLPLKKLIKDFNIYIKIHPKKPEEDGQWQAALITAIYSAVYNKIMPVSCMVLGGITKKGVIIPINIEKLDILRNQEYTILISGENKDNISINFMYSFEFIYLHHIDEIISFLKEIEGVEAHRRYNDFLCEE